MSDTITLYIQDNRCHNSGTPFFRLSSVLAERYRPFLLNMLYRYGLRITSRINGHEKESVDHAQWSVVLPHVSNFAAHA